MVVSFLIHRPVKTLKAKRLLNERLMRVVQDNVLAEFMKEHNLINYLMHSLLQCTTVLVNSLVGDCRYVVEQDDLDSLAKAPEMKLNAPNTTVMLATKR